MLDELKHIIESNPDMPAENMDLLQIDEIEYERMNINQIDNILYGAKILESINKKKRKCDGKKYKILMNKKDKSELDPGE